MRAVDDVSLKVAANEIYGIAGESSSGKSSLVKTIARAIRPPLDWCRAAGIEPMLAVNLGTRGPDEAGRFIACNHSRRHRALRPAPPARLGAAARG